MGLRDGLRDFLHIPRKGRRARSEVMSEASATGTPGKADPALPMPRPGTESTPDLRIGPSTLPTPSPLTSRDQKSSGMGTSASRMNHLTILPAT
jgi:hypothetical protein